MAKQIIITGATGFIGKSLCFHLLEHGYAVTVLSRNPENAADIFENSVKTTHWNGKDIESWKEVLEASYAVINLAGENIASGRWTPGKKKNILDSRINASRAISEAIKHARNKPEVIIQGSATGYYGSRGDEQLTEISRKGTGFLADVVEQVESTMKKMKSGDTRIVFIRTGIVLERESGILSRMMLPFRFFAGGPPGSGKQWLSWIHLEDEINAIRFLLENKEAEGIYNLTAPDPVTMKEFCSIMGKAMKRPSWLPVPAFALKILFGQMADETILTSQRVLPQRLLEAGYNFKHNNLENALSDILKNRKS